ncbi:collagen alpha-1(XXI) chain [Trichonephila clavipes]|nr:collagen alpha-1(XXI) chain [Trichonephila clavipes]
MVSGSFRQQYVYGFSTSVVFLRGTTNLSHSRTYGLEGFPSNTLLMILNSSAALAIPRPSTTSPVILPCVKSFRLYAGELLRCSIFLVVVMKSLDYIIAQDISNSVSICPEIRPGEDDLPGFDFIRKFRLDDFEFDFPGVKKVKGSNRMQTAYRLSKRADLTLPTR